MDAVIGRVEIERSVGPAGGWSRQIGVDRESGTRVLVSQQTADIIDEAHGELLGRRLRTASRLRHPGLSPLVDAGLTDDGAYMVEQIEKALPLEDGRCVVPRGERLGQALIRVVEALAYIHRHGLAHGTVSRRTVVSDGRSMRLTGVGLKQASGASTMNDDLECWAELARDLLGGKPVGNEVNELVLTAANEVRRASEEGRTLTAARVAGGLRRALGESGETVMTSDNVEDRSVGMKRMQAVTHFTTSVLIGLLTTVVTVAALVGLVALGVMSFLDRLPEEVVVPNVIGMSESDARERLSDHGLETGNVRRVYREDEPIGEVVGATPEVGMTVREGRPVTLIVSRGAAQVRVPRLTGLRSEEARTVLENLGLAASEAGTVRADAVEGEIVRQDPGIGQIVAQGEPVQYFLSGGPDYGMLVIESEDDESRQMLFRQLEIVVPMGDPLQRVEVKEGYDALDTTYDRLHRPGDQITLNTEGRPGKQIEVIIEGERVYSTQL